KIAATVGDGVRQHTPEQGLETHPTGCRGCVEKVADSAYPVLILDRDPEPEVRQRPSPRPRDARHVIERPRRPSATAACGNDVRQKQTGALDDAVERQGITIIRAHPALRFVDTRKMCQRAAAITACTRSIVGMSTCS